jgi:hypothetical protein
MGVISASSNDAAAKGTNRVQYLISRLELSRADFAPILGNHETTINHCPLLNFDAGSGLVLLDTPRAEEFRWRQND